MCRALKSVDVSQFKTIDEALNALEIELLDLKDIATSTDFSVPAQADQFSRNVTFIKSYYDRAEHLLREGMNGAR